ncbi:MAG: PIN domain-containing protein [Pedosphaera sp.]|nr:PIN domain-containing protein [Pedosphaera sp.]
MKLIDTSSWVEYFRGRESEPGDRVEVLVLSGEAAWCDMTLVELWQGVRGAREKRELAAMESEIERVPVDETVWRLASKLALRSREKGIIVPISDIVIAACATAHKLELEHCDGHFDDILPLAKSLLT